MEKIRAAKATLATPKATTESAPATQRQDVKADPSSAATNSTPTASAPSTSGAAPEGQAIPYERFKEVNDAKRAAEERLAKLEADKKSLEDRLAAEEKQRQVAKTNDLAERLLKGEVDEKTLGPALDALISQRISAATAGLSEKSEESMLRAQLGTMPPEAQDAVLKVMRETHLSLEESKVLASIRSPSLFPDSAAGFSPGLHPTAIGGRVAPPTPGPINWEAEMEKAKKQGKAARDAVGLAWMKAQRSK